MEYKFNYDVTKEDYLAFNNAHMKKTLAGNLLRTGSKTFIALSAVFLIVVQFYAKDFTFSSFVFAFLFLYIVFGSAFLRKKRIFKVYESNKSLHQQNEITVTESFVCEKNAVSATTMNKDQITEIVESKHGIYIYYSKIQCFLIPSHAFAGEEEFKNFAEFVKANYVTEKVKFFKCRENSVWQTVLGIVCGTALFAVYFFSILKR